MEPTEAPRGGEPVPPPAPVPPSEIVALPVPSVAPQPIVPVESPVAPLQIPTGALALPLPPLPSAPPPPIPASTSGGQVATQSPAAPGQSTANLLAELRAMDFEEMHEHFRLDIATKLNDPLWGIPKDKVRDALKMNTGTLPV